jgi:hypothetical protein
MAQVTVESRVCCLQRARRDGTGAGADRLSEWQSACELADHVIWAVGAQKIVRDLGEGLRRVREYSYPLEHQRMHALNGTGSFVTKILVVERERPGRISVLLVKEALGF